MAVKGASQFGILDPCLIVLAPSLFISLSHWGREEKKEERRSPS
jgi:hypothetical protein